VLLLPLLHGFVTAVTVTAVTVTAVTVTAVTVKTVTFTAVTLTTVTVLLSVKVPMLVLHVYVHLRRALLPT
jgi:hypothetical protein